MKQALLQGTPGPSYLQEPGGMRDHADAGSEGWTIIQEGIQQDGPGSTALNQEFTVKVKCILDQ